MTVYFLAVSRTFYLNRMLYTEFNMNIGYRSSTLCELLILPWQKLILMSDRWNESNRNSRRLLFRLTYSPTKRVLVPALFSYDLQSFDTLISGHLYIIPVPSIRATLKGKNVILAQILLTSLLWIWLVWPQICTTVAAFSVYRDEDWIQNMVKKRWSNHQKNPGYIISQIVGDFEPGVPEKSFFFVKGLYFWSIQKSGTIVVCWIIFFTRRDDETEAKCELNSATSGQFDFLECRTVCQEC